VKKFWNVFFQFLSLIGIAYGIQIVYQAFILKANLDMVEETWWIGDMLIQPLAALASAVVAFALANKSQIYYPIEIVAGLVALVNLSDAALALLGRMNLMTITWVNCVIIGTEYAIIFYVAGKKDTDLKKKRESEKRTAAVVHEEPAGGEVIEWPKQ